MIDLETNLRNWCKTEDSYLFEQHLYLPFKYMAAAIATKYKVKSNDIEETIHDMVAHASVTLPEKYDEIKGKAKSMLYIIMSQYLLNKIQSNNRKKRNIIYIEDVEVCNDKAVVIEISIDNMEELKQTLLQNRDLFDNMDNQLQIKIKNAVLDCIECPNNFNIKYNSYTVDIAKKCKTTINKVYETIAVMRNIQNSSV